MFSEGALYLPTSSELPGPSLGKMILQNIHQSALLDAEKLQEYQRRVISLRSRPTIFLQIKSEDRSQIRHSAKINAIPGNVTSLLKGKDAWILI